MKLLSSLMSGMLFGAGLAASGMTDTAKVIGFLNVFENWDPDLLFVMGSAVVTTLVSFRFVLRRKYPVFDTEFFLPANTVIDPKLVLGAVLFGIGWGLYGYCPGPAIAAIVYTQPATIVFLAMMLGGMFGADKFSRVLVQRKRYEVR